MDINEEEILVVMPYKYEGAQGHELLLALKCWKKFCTFKYHFVVVGEVKEDTKQDFPWVEFIDCPTIEKCELQYNPHLDIQHKMELVMNKFADKYNGFIRVADDNYAIKKFSLEDITTVHYHAEGFTGAETAPTFVWAHDMWKTRQLLDKEKLPHVNYTIHYPYWYEFAKLKEIWDKFDMRNESYVLENVYFNYYKHEKPILDSNIRFGVCNLKTYQELDELAINNQKIKFIFNTVDGWSKRFEDILYELINEKKNILITGGLGFIGECLNRHLKEYNIINADIKNGLNVTNAESMEELLNKHKIDVIIHLAAIPGIAYSVEHPTEVFDNNVNGFEVIADLAVKHNIPHVIYASSSSVYGDDGVTPKSPYALSKKKNEEQAEKYSALGNTKFTGLRLFTVYGKRTRPDLAIAKFIEAISMDKELVVYGDGNQSRDFTYVEDVCNVIKKIIFSDKEWKHEIFDVGYGESVTINELINIIKNYINVNYTKIVYESPRNYDVLHTLSNTDKLYEWFDIKPTTSINEGLKIILNKTNKIMKQENNVYKAEEGKLIVRKADNFIMGDAIDLGINDNIDNYEERDFTEEEIDIFYKSVGVIRHEENPKYENKKEREARRNIEKTTEE